MHVHPQHASLWEQSGLSPEGVFADARVKPWRSLADRENCTLDLPANAGPAVRLHVKRYPASAVTGGRSPAAIEAAGHDLLLAHAIPTAPLVAWADLPDGRSFTAWLDLAGYQPGDKLVERGTPFARLLEPTAELAGRLHAAGLHHRDLYLCHFLCRQTEAGTVEARLIDTARVARMSRFFLLRRRWVVKDLSQFDYSLRRLQVAEAERSAWLERYAAARGDGTTPATYRSAIARKVARIARHDARLNRRQPNRNVSIPGQPA